MSDLRIFKPRDKNETCVHWCDCYKKAEWCVEFNHLEEPYWEFYCQEHLDKLKKEEIKNEH